MQTSDGLVRQSFLRDETLKRAFVRSLEVIGEAVKKVPETIRQRDAEIEWRTIAGMRDRLIHDYFGVDFEIVWDAVTTKIPILAERIANLLEKLDDSREDR